MNTYTPRVPDLSGIEIPYDLELLVERLAEVAHDTWAAKRIAEGWSYGNERNDQKKTNPCLVPYDDLPDGEKAYDRDMARATIRMILAQGYVIEPRAVSTDDRV